MLWCSEHHHPGAILIGKFLYITYCTIVSLSTSGKLHWLFQIPQVLSYDHDSVSFKLAYSCANSHFLNGCVQKEEESQQSRHLPKSACYKWSVQLPSVLSPQVLNSQQSNVVKSFLKETNKNWCTSNGICARNVHLIMITS